MEDSFTTISQFYTQQDDFRTFELDFWSIFSDHPAKLAQYYPPDDEPSGYHYEGD